jgi:uncharacterized damage-inducible protein DinB
MTIDEARQLFDYGSWANARFFGVARGLTADQLEAPAAGSFPSIVGTLGHIVGAEWVWLRRWLGESPAGMPAWVAQPSLPDLEARLAAVEKERAALLASLEDRDLDRVVTYRTLSGQPFSDPLHELIRHVVNHSTYHRGQLVAQLRQIGQTPPGSDLLFYVRESRQR